MGEVTHRQLQGSVELKLRIKARSPDTPHLSSNASSADILADGIRYERGGVVLRARKCFETVTRVVAQSPEQAAEAWWRLANLHRLHSSWNDALTAARTAGDL